MDDETPEARYQHGLQALCARYGPVLLSIDRKRLRRMTTAQVDALLADLEAEMQTERQR